MRKYRVGLIAWENEVNKNTKIKGKYFVIEFLKVKPKSNFNGGYELVVITNNINNARRVLQLLVASVAVLNAGAYFTFDSLPNITPLQVDDEEMPRTFGEGPISSFSDIPKAAKITAIASYRRKDYLALLKYQLGCELHSNNLMDLYPEYLKLSKNPADHLRIAYSIILFYSVIEELGLEIRASSQNPSKIKGVWNPKVRNDLETRLKNAKVVLDEKLDWNLRSTPTKIQKLKKPIVGKKSEWATSSIRDSEIDICEAILYASWLRSKIASHKLDSTFTSLSIYDASNLNFLARHLLLSILER